VDAELFAVVQDAEVGVLDDHGDDLSGVGGAEAESLAGNHGDAIFGDSALDVDRLGGKHSRQGCGGQACAGEVGEAVDGYRAGPAAHEAAVGDNVHEVAVQAQGDALADKVGVDGEALVGDGDDAVADH